MENIVIKFGRFLLKNIFKKVNSLPSETDMEFYKNKNVRFLQ